MRVFLVLVLLGISSFIFSACVTAPTSPMAFTDENILRIKQGMSSDEILELFGSPQNIRVAVCGKPPNTWNCTTWEYSGYFDERARFTFANINGSLKLNDFSIQRN